MRRYSAVLGLLVILFSGCAAQGFFQPLHYSWDRVDRAEIYQTIRASMPSCLRNLS